MNIEETKAAIAVMQAYVGGKEIEVDYAGLEGTGFTYTDTPVWDWKHYTYRVRVTKPSINWDHVAPEYNYLARDGDGGAFLYNGKPIICSRIWQAGLGDATKANGFTSYTTGTCDWKDSLVVRPGYGEEDK